MTQLRDRLDQAPMTPFQWQAVAVCTMLIMIDGFDVLVMAFTASSVSAEWALSGKQLGLLFSAGLFGMAGGSLFLAPVADRIGRQRITLLCLLIVTAGMLASAAAQTHWRCGCGGANPAGHPHPARGRPQRRARRTSPCGRAAPAWW